MIPERTILVESAGSANAEHTRRDVLDISQKQQVGSDQRSSAAMKATDGAWSGANVKANSAETSAGIRLGSAIPTFGMGQARRKQTKMLANAATPTASSSRLSQILYP
jgi:hypothetical protein